MPEAKEKKVRVYKLATEYNLSAENLLEFLQKKGHDVKSHMSIVSDDMIQDINDHFKKDIEKAEKHKKKVAEFNSNAKIRLLYIWAPINTRRLIIIIAQIGVSLSGLVFPYLI